MAQCQSILRYFSTINKGKNGETLYPKDDRLDFAFEIDALGEASDDFSVTSTLSLISKATEQKTGEFLRVHWPNYLQTLEKQLTKNQVYSKLHLVGMNMSLADIVIGAHMLKLVFNKSSPKKNELLTTLKQYPMTYNWATETINGTFFGWMQTQPPSPL